MLFRSVLVTNDAEASTAQPLVVLPAGVTYVTMSARASVTEAAIRTNATVRLSIVVARKNLTILKRVSSLRFACANRDPAKLWFCTRCSLKVVQLRCHGSLEKNKHLAGNSAAKVQKFAARGRVMPQAFMISMGRCIGSNK